MSKRNGEHRCVTELPPIEIWIRSWAPDPRGGFLWKTKELHVTIAKKNVVAKLTPNIVPQMFDIGVGSVGMPIPITLNNLVCRTSRDLTGLDRWRVLIPFDAANHFDTERAVTKLGEIACAVGFEATIDAV